MGYEPEAPAVECRRGSSIHSPARRRSQENRRTDDSHHHWTRKWRAGHHVLRRKISPRKCGHDARKIRKIIAIYESIGYYWALPLRRLTSRLPPHSGRVSRRSRVSIDLSRGGKA